MSREQLEQNVGEYVRLLESGEIEENEKPLESFLEEKGAAVTPLYDSSGHGENYPIDFYDVEYDADIGVTYISAFLRKSRQRCWYKRQSFQEIFFQKKKRHL